MSTPLQLNEIRSQDVSMGILINNILGSKKDNSDLIRQFTDKNDYEIREFNNRGQKLRAAMITCKFLFNYYGPVMLLPPSGRGWLAEHDYSDLEDQELLTEIFSKKGWFDFVKQSIGLQETYGSIQHVQRTKDGQPRKAYLFIDTFSKSRGISVVLKNPWTFGRLKSLEEFEALMAHASSVEDPSESDDEI